jgi:hypothetical protein
MSSNSSDLLDRLRSHDPVVQAPAIVEAEKSRAYEAAPIVAELLKSTMIGFGRVRQKRWVGSALRRQIDTAGNSCRC